MIFDKTKYILKTIGEGEGMAIFAIALPFALIFDLIALPFHLFKGNK